MEIKEKTKDGKIIFKSLDLQGNNIIDWCVIPICSDCGQLTEDQVIFFDAGCGFTDKWYLPFCGLCKQQLSEQYPIETKKDNN